MSIGSQSGSMSVIAMLRQLRGPTPLSLEVLSERTRLHRVTLIPTGFVLAVNIHVSAIQCCLLDRGCEPYYRHFLSTL
jgi:hypothetical protein